MRRWLLVCLLGWALVAQGQTVAVTGHGGRVGPDLLRQLVLPPGLAWAESVEEAAWVLATDLESFGAALQARRPVLGVGLPQARAAPRLTSDCDCAVIWAETDPRHQYQLIRRLLSSVQRIGLITTEESEWMAPPVIRAARQDGLSMIHLPVTPAQMARQVPGLLARVDALLALSDEQLYNAGTARLVLLTSYRQGAPVIGPDAEFVRAGAVASTHVPPVGWQQAVLDALEQRQRSGHWPVSGFNPHVEVVVNRHVGRAFGLPQLDPERLQRLLQEGP